MKDLSTLLKVLVSLFVFDVSYGSIVSMMEKFYSPHNIIESSFFLVVIFAVTYYSLFYLSPLATKRACLNPIKIGEKHNLKNEI